jgi:CheY-like chemotaxis protein
MIRKTGIHVDVVQDGLMALDAIKRKRYDLILMDGQMPNMDGLEATQKIRNELGLTDLPIIGITALAMKGDKEKCLAAGMSDYIPKPIEPASLYKILCKWLIDITDKVARV